MAISSSKPRSGVSPATRFLSGLEKRPLAELLFKDVMAFNVPKIALTRTWDECADTATLELANSAITLLSSLSVPPVVRRPVSWLSGIPLHELKNTVSKQATTPVKLARLGASFGFLFPFASAFWAVPFARNLLTLQRTQSANFESIIGFENPDSNQPKRSFEEEKRYQKNMAWRIFLGGMSLGAASVVGFSLGARRAAAATQEGSKTWVANLLENRHPKLWQKFFDGYDLKGDSANQVAPGGAQLIFWGIPAYLGWVHAARGKNERRERTLQAINGVFWFFFGSKVKVVLFNRTDSKRKEAGEPEFWKKEFLEKLAGKTLPAQDWKAHFRENADFMKTLRNQLKDLSYADIQENALDKTSEAYQKLVKLKSWKFAVSGLATPIIALALVQFINFAITAQKIKQQGAPPPPGLADTPPLKPSPLPSSAIPASAAAPITPPAQSFLFPSTPLPPSLMMMPGINPPQGVNSPFQTFISAGGA